MPAWAYIAQDIYDEAFAREAGKAYPVIDAFEREVGHAINRDWLENTARRLSCVPKTLPPLWQQGRVVYAVAKATLLRQVKANRRALMVDVGTARGFSALCALWAAMDAQTPCNIVSLDVVDPAERRYRQSSAEVDGKKTVRELVAPWPEASAIEFLKCAGAAWFRAGNDRVHFAFLDGKHHYEPVSEELFHLARRQEPGDVIVLDDVQEPGVERAIAESRGYDVRLVQPNEHRVYAVATKFGGTT